MLSIHETFKYGGNKKVRVIGDPEEPWFVAKDVCEVLELSDVSMTLNRLDEDEKLIQKVFVSGFSRDMWTINESGLYALIMTSYKPEAKAFKKWITSEVLPSIRKTGSYNAAPEPQALSAAELILAQAQQLVSQEKLLREHENRLAKLEAAKAEAEKQLLALPPASSPVPEETLDMKVRRIVSSYCYGTSSDHQLIWRCLYRQFELRYHRRIIAKGNESKLQAAVRLGLIEQLYDLAYTLLRPDEEGLFSCAVKTF